MVYKYIHCLLRGFKLTEFLLGKQTNKTLCLSYPPVKTLSNFHFIHFFSKLLFLYIFLPFLGYLNAAVSSHSSECDSTTVKRKINKLNCNYFSSFSSHSSECDSTTVERKTNKLYCNYFPSPCFPGGSEVEEDICIGKIFRRSNDLFRLDYNSLYKYVYHTWKQTIQTIKWDCKCHSISIYFK